MREEIESALVAYLQNDLPGPFFVAFDNPEDLNFLAGLVPPLARKLNISDFCPGPDIWPDGDKLLNELRREDGACVFLRGLGEAMALLDGRWKALDAIAGLRVEGRRGGLIVPLWHGHDYVEALRKDPRWRGQIMAFAKTRKYWRYQQYEYVMPFATACGSFQELLRVVEAGHSGAVSVTTRQKLAPEWGRVISSPYEAYLDAHPECEIAEVMFPQACWASFLDAGRMLDEDFFSADSLLRLLVNGTENAYLRLVLSNVEDYAQFRKQFAAMFYELDAEEPVFATMARARRELLTQIADETLDDRKN